jgi:hypothetical protein
VLAPSPAAAPYRASGLVQWRKAAVHHDEPFLIGQRASAAERSTNIVASSVVGLSILVSLVGGPFG